MKIATSCRKLASRWVVCCALGFVTLAPSGLYADLIAPQPTGFCSYAQQAAYLSWPSVSGAVSYKIFRSTNNTFSWNNRVIARTTNSYYYDSSAVCGATYYYWVCPCDLDYVYAKKDAYVRVDMTGGACEDECDDLQPQPVGSAASNGSYAYLSWSAPACYAVEKYGIYRGTSPNFSWSTCTRVGSTTGLYYYDYAVQKGKTYYYWIATYDGEYWTVTKARYKAVSIPYGSDPVPPQAYASAASNGSYAYISWTKSTDSRVVDYGIYRGTSSTFSWSTCTRVGTTTGSYYYDYSVQKGKKYYYWVAAGSSSKWYINAAKYASCSIPYVDLVPSQPTASVNGSTAYVRITWPSVSGCTAGYSIFRSTSSTFSWSSTPRIAITYSTYYNDTTATPGVKYYYWVCPRDDNYTYCNRAKYAYGIRSLTAPSVSGSSSSIGGNVLTWSTVSGCTAGYAIFRSTSSTFSWSSTPRIAITYDTFYTDRSAVRGVKYYYWIAPRTSLYTYANSSRYAVLKRP